MNGIKRERGQSRAGSSLIEVLVALAILSISIAGSVPIIETSVRQMERAQNLSHARRQLAYHLARAEVGEGDLDEFPGEDGRWRVTRRTIREGRMGGVEARLETIYVEVTWREGVLERQLVAEEQIIVPATR